MRVRVRVRVRVGVRVRVRVSPERTAAEQVPRAVGQAHGAAFGSAQPAQRRLELRALDRAPAPQVCEGVPPPRRVRLHQVALGVLWGGEEEYAAADRHIEHQVALLPQHAHAWPPEAEHSTQRGRKPHAHRVSQADAYRALQEAKREPSALERRHPVHPERRQAGGAKSGRRQFAEPTTEMRAPLAPREQEKWRGIKKEVWT